MYSAALSGRTFICTTGSKPFRMRCGVRAVNVLCDLEYKCGLDRDLAFVLLFFIWTHLSAI